jgi:hypothetical protein
MFTPLRWVSGQRAPPTAYDACVPTPKSPPGGTDLQRRPCASAQAVAATRAVRPETPIFP